MRGGGKAWAPKNLLEQLQMFLFLLFFRCYVLSIACS